MSLVEVSRRRHRLESLFKRIKELEADPELMSHWARYLCVLTSGFLEVSVQVIYSHYAEDRAAPNVRNYVEAQLRTFHNPTMGKILELTRSFSPTWEDSLKEATEGEPRDAVDSIVANRHQIAHGESIGLSFVQMEKYFRGAVKVVDLLMAQCGD